MAERRHQILDRAADRRAGARPLVGREVSEPLEQGLDLVRALLEMLAALVRGLEGFARTLDRRFLNQAHVLEQRQRRVNDTRTRRIFAAGQLFDRPDEIVAVARLVGDQFQKHQAKLAALEHPPAAPASPASPLGTIAKVEVKWPPMPLPAAPPAHRHHRLGKVDLEMSAWPATMMPTHTMLLFMTSLRYILDVSEARD